MESYSVNEKDHATAEKDRKIVGEMLDIGNVCNYIVIGIDHNADHNPVILSSVPPDELGHFLLALGVLHSAG